MKKRRGADEAEEAITRTQRVDSLQMVPRGYDKSPSRKRNAPAEHLHHQTNHLHHQTKTSSSSNNGNLPTSSQCDDGCSILEDVQGTIDGADSQHDDKRDETAVVKNAGHGDQKATGVSQGPPPPSDQRGRHQDLLASTSSIRRSLGSGGSPPNLHISSMDRDADNIELVVRNTNTPGQLPLHKEEEILEEIYHLLCFEEEFSSQDVEVYEFIRLHLRLEQCWTATTLKNYVITKLAPRLYKFPFPLKMITNISTALNIKYSKELELGIERRFNVGVHLKDDRTFHGLSFWPECALAPTHQHQCAPRSGGSRREDNGREREESMNLEVARGARRNDSEISNLFTSPSIPRKRRSQTSNERESPERPPTSTQRTRFDPTQQRLAVRFVYRQFKEFGRGLRVNNNEFWRKFINHELRSSAGKSPQAWRTHFHQVLKHRIHKMPFAPFRRRELLSFLGMDTKVVPDDEPDLDDSFSESEERF